MQRCPRPGAGGACPQAAMAYPPIMKWILASAVGAGALAVAGAWVMRAVDASGPGPARAAEPDPAHRATLQRWVEFEGACDASGAVPIDERHFAVADDEDNVL